jgi:riboflavin synthase
MFTGIITAIGHIIATQALGASPDHGKRLTIQTPPTYLHDVILGQSIAMNGACMTVATLDIVNAQLTVDISLESLSKTTGLDTPGPINLEKALQVGERLGGHLVSGHIDGLGQVHAFSQVGESWTLCIDTPLGLAKFLAYKGSITVNGVSLTINHVIDLPDQCRISLNLIPHTVANTTLEQLEVGQDVNLEVDQIARYCERMLSYQNTV